MYEIIGYWGGNRVVVGTFTDEASAIAFWLTQIHTAIYHDGRLVPLVGTGNGTYRRAKKA